MLLCSMTTLLFPVATHPVKAMIGMSDGPSAAKVQFEKTKDAFTREDELQASSDGPMTLRVLKFSRRTIESDTVEPLAKLTRGRPIC